MGADELLLELPRERNSVPGGIPIDEFIAKMTDVLGEEVYADVPCRIQSSVVCLMFQNFTATFPHLHVKQNNLLLSVDRKSALLLKQLAYGHAPTDEPPAVIALEIRKFFESERDPRCEFTDTLYIEGGQEHSVFIAVSFFNGMYSARYFDPNIEEPIMEDAMIELMDALDITLDVWVHHSKSGNAFGHCQAITMLNLCRVLDGTLSISGNQHFIYSPINQCVRSCAYVEFPERCEDERNLIVQLANEKTSFI